MARKLERSLPTRHVSETLELGERVSETGQGGGMMRTQKLGGAGVWLAVVLGMWGCTGLGGTSVTLPSSAYFTALSAELKSLRALAQKQETVVKDCPPPAGSCDDARYTMGLVALFANRSDALNIFEGLRTTAPNSRFAAPSTRWIELLQESAPVARQDTALYALLREEVLHNLLEKEEQYMNRIGKKSEPERHVTELRRSMTDE